MHIETGIRDRKPVVCLICLVLPVFISVLATACGEEVQIGRIGSPQSLPTGEPRNGCEQQSWNELAPARIRATGETAGIGYNTYYWQL
jgi:hypothetical protein